MKVARPRISPNNPGSLNNRIPVASRLLALVAAFALAHPGAAAAASHQVQSGFISISPIFGPICGVTAALAFTHILHRWRIARARAAAKVDQ
jgi:hypothetical protein